MKVKIRPTQGTEEVHVFNSWPQRPRKVVVSGEALSICSDVFQQSRCCTSAAPCRNHMPRRQAPKQSKYPQSLIPCPDGISRILKAPDRNHVPALSPTLFDCCWRMYSHLEPQHQDLLCAWEILDCANMGRSCNPIPLDIQSPEGPSTSKDSSYGFALFKYWNPLGKPNSTVNLYPKRVQAPKCVREPLSQEGPSTQMWRW